MLRRRWLRVALVGLAGLVAVLVVRAAMMTAPPEPERTDAPLPDLDEDAAVAHLAAALQIPTVSVTETHGDPATFLRLHALLQQQFPRVHQTLQREIVGDYSLVFRWPGQQPALEPILMLGHMDVVPVEPGTEGDWGQPPFSGAVVDGEIWGRGAMDDKTAVVGLLEAVETLLAAGFAPQRTIVLAFGHDEEIGGRNGAQAIAARFEAASERFAIVVDEGGVVVQGSLPGVEVPVALVGVAEKGFASLELIARAKGGHSSMPEANNAIATLSRAVQRVEAHQMQGRIDGPTRAMLEAIGPHMSFGMRIGVANLWLLQRVLVKVMEGRPPSAALVRTTTAPTVFHAGTADNVLPQKASAVINFRILPGDTVESVIEHVRAVAAEPNVEIRCLDACWNPSEPSPTQTDGFGWLSDSIRRAFPDAAVAPYLVVGVTDAHHYQHLSAGTYRFLPIQLSDEERSRFHGTGERIDAAGYLRAVRFYVDFLMRASSAE